MSVTFNNRILVNHQEQIYKIQKSQEWKKTNTVSNLAKKALFTIAQTYRAIPYYFTLFAYWVRGRDLFEIKTIPINKYVRIWNGIKKVKDFSPQITWFSKEFDYTDFKIVEGKKSNYQYNTKIKLFKMRNGEFLTKKVVIIDGIFRKFAKAFWYTGEKNH